MKLGYYLLLALSLQGIPLYGVSKYFIAVKKNTGKLETVLNDLSNYTLLFPPKGHFYADPMLVQHDGVNYIFFEDYNYQKGRIVYVTVDKDLTISQPKPALDLACHLSFPYIFKEDGKFYMVPESAAASEVSLFEAVQFPDKWKKARVLLRPGWYGDSILFKYGEYYWIFTSKDSVADLHIYYSKSMFYGFQQHPINAKKIQGRNAGKPFHYDGKLIRPVMNCGPNGTTYGYSMTLKEIVELTPTTFVERDLQRIEPTWAPNLSGTHTFNINDDLVVYDGRRFLPEGTA